MSKLGERLRKLRKLADETLGQVGEATGIDYSSLSRLENGERRASDEQLSKLSQHYENANIVELLRLRDEDDATDRDPQSLRLGVPHSSLASSALALIYDGLPPEITITSFCSRKQIVWYPDREFDAPRHPPGPQNVFQGSPPYGWPERTPNSNAGDEEVLAAGQLLQLLKAGEIDCMLAVGEFAEQNPFELVRVAKLAQCLSVTTFVLLTTSEERPPQTERNVTEETSSRDDFRLAWTAAEDSGKVRCLYEPLTMAQYTVEAFLSKSGIKREEAQPSNWTAFTAQIAQVLKGTDPVLFVGWQPHVSWLVHWAKAHSDRGVFIGYLRYLPDENVFNDYVSMDLLVSRQNVERVMAKSKVLNELLLALANKAKQINSAKIVSKVTHDVAYYLDMTPELFWREAQRMRFGCEVYIEWHLEMRRSTSAGATI